jgi:hypothetical protein
MRALAPGVRLSPIQGECDHRIDVVSAAKGGDFCQGVLKEYLSG